MKSRHQMGPASITSEPSSSETAQSSGSLPLQRSFGLHAPPMRAETSVKSAEMPWAVDKIVQNAVGRSERLFADLRIGFSMAVFLAFLIGPLRGKSAPPAQWFLEGLALVIALSFSIYVRRRSARRARQAIGERLLFASVTVDAGLAFLALLGNVFGAKPAYVGVLGSLDVAIVPIILFTSVFRASKRAVLWSGIINALGLAALLLVDRSVGIAPDPQKGAFLALYFTGALVAAFAATSRAREMFGGIAAASAEAERARGSIFSLLQDHHDWRSTLCNLQLNADRLLDAKSDSPAVSKLVRQLAVDVERLGASSRKTRDRALSALEGLANVTAANPIVALQSARASFGVTPITIFARASVEETSPVLFGGGTDGLSRLFSHLIQNALEGNGTSGAESLKIEVFLENDRNLVVRFDDDGPGFPSTLLSVLGSKTGCSTKPNSAGIGLWLASLGLASVGGQLRFANTASGARVEVLLPVDA